MSPKRELLAERLLIEAKNRVGSLDGFVARGRALGYLLQEPLEENIRKTLEELYLYENVFHAADEGKGYVFVPAIKNPKLREFGGKVEGCLPLHRHLLETQGTVVAFTHLFAKEIEPLHAHGGEERMVVFKGRAAFKVLSGEGEASLSIEKGWLLVPPYVWHGYSAKGEVFLTVLKPPYLPLREKVDGGALGRVEVGFLKEEPYGLVAEPFHGYREALFLRPVTLGEGPKAFLALGRAKVKVGADVLTMQQGDMLYADDAVELHPEGAVYGAFLRSVDVLG